jgi:GNAT superfamily N-acetyltransferase
MPETEVEVRPASAGDFEAIERIAGANGASTTSPSWPDWLYLDHLMSSATLLVAERAGAVVGFAGAAVVGGRRPAGHVTDLFLDPPAQGAGIGKHLLRDLFLAVDVTAWTTCSSADPRALTVYARAGLQPLWPVLYLEMPLNVPAPDVTGDWWPARAGSREVDPAVAAALELHWSGRDFSAQYVHWVSRPGGLAFRVEVDGRPIAVGVVRDARIGPGRVLDHLAVAPYADPWLAVVAALQSQAVRGTTVDPTARLTFAVAGHQPAVGSLLALGGRITDHDTFCATDATLVDPARVVIDPSFG